MKTCNRCLREYDDTISVQKNPADDLGEIFLKPPIRREKTIFVLIAGRIWGSLPCLALVNN